MKLTKSLNPADVQRKWLVFDAAGVPVGRLSTAVATKLAGRDSAKFTPHVDSGDFVIIINAGQAVLTGSKTDQKKYYRHTGYPGGIKERSAKDLMNDNPQKVIEAAVYGMLPKNKLRNGMMKRLKVYADDNHPHAAQNPTAVGIKEAK